MREVKCFCSNLYRTIDFKVTAVIPELTGLTAVWYLTSVEHQPRTLYAVAGTITSIVLQPDRSAQY